MMKMASSNKNLSTKTNEEEREKGDEHQRRRRRRVLCWSCGEPLKKNTNSNNDDDDDCKIGRQRLPLSFSLQNVRRRRPSVVDIDPLALRAARRARNVRGGREGTGNDDERTSKETPPGRVRGEEEDSEATEDRAREKEYSEALSARVNEAYGKLRDPLSRAKYLFALKSGATSVDDEEEEKKEEDTWGDEEEDENGERKRETVSPELLFLVMDVREAIEDAGEDVEALMKLKEENEERVEEATTRVGEALDDETTFDKEKARKAIVELTYYERIRKEIIERL